MIPVVWYDACRGNWDHGVLMGIFDKHANVFFQHNKKKENCHFLEPLEFGVIIIAGRPDVMYLRNYLQENFKKGIVILTSEEDSFFNWEVIPEHFEIWTQYYAPNKSAIKTRLLLGPPSRIKDYKINRKPFAEREYFFSFVGQIQNPFRQQCLGAMKTWGEKGVFVHVADSFGGIENGIEYQRYLDIMCNSKFVICPAGSMCVDSFRLYEALTCGAIPITDERSPRDTPGFNYWNEVYPNHGIVTVSDWRDLSRIMYDIENRHLLVDRDGLWWEQYLQDLENKLLKYAADKN
jgi:hypothetical protein